MMAYMYTKFEYFTLLHIHSRKSVRVLCPTTLIEDIKII